MVIGRLNEGMLSEVARDQLIHNVMGDGYDLPAVEHGIMAAAHGSVLIEGNREFLVSTEWFAMVGKVLDAMTYGSGDVDYVMDALEHVITVIQRFRKTKRVTDGKVAVAVGKVFSTLLHGGFQIATGNDGFSQLIGKDVVGHDVAHRDRVFKAVRLVIENRSGGQVRSHNRHLHLLNEFDEAAFSDAGLSSAWIS